MADRPRLVSDNLRIPRRVSDDLPYPPIAKGPPLPPGPRFLLQCLLDHKELSAAELREWIQIILENDAR